jgi:hypothetical protein
MVHWWVLLVHRGHLFLTLQITLFSGVFWGHLISTNIPPRKEKGSYAYSLRVGRELIFMSRSRHKLPPPPMPHDLYTFWFMMMFMSCFRIRSIKPNGPGLYLRLYRTLSSCQPNGPSLYLRLCPTLSSCQPNGPSLTWGFTLHFPHVNPMIPALLEALPYTFLMSTQWPEPLLEALPYTFLMPT